MGFRAGDAVLHRPSGETWVVAIDEENGMVSWAGWPEGMAHAEDCELKRAATDEQRLKQLEACAAMSNGSDHRRSAALRQIARKEGGVMGACVFCGEELLGKADVPCSRPYECRERLKRMHEEADIRAGETEQERDALAERVKALETVVAIAREVATVSPPDTLGLETALAKLDAWKKGKKGGT